MAGDNYLLTITIAISQMESDQIRAGRPEVSSKRQRIKITKTLK